jgi:hypothetical protein
LRSSTKKPAGRKIFRAVQRTKVRNAEFSVLHLFENDSQFQNVNRYSLTFPLHPAVPKILLLQLRSGQFFPLPLAVVLL